MAKPFSIQSPEDIAKEYGGNKQKIAQAMQMGVVDPTAGVLAGMFIDRMRAAQMQEGGGLQPTVAQQVFAPPAPQPPPGGMGAPQGAPPMAPQGMGTPPMPPAPPQGAPMGMADGGLASLPVPDTMFDEPTNGGFDDGYAGGGLVAFADGGYAEGPMGPWFEAEVKRIFPNAIIAGRGRTPEHNREVGGVSGSYHIGDNALDVKPPPGMGFTEFGSALRQHFGPSIDTIFNTKGHYDHVHLEPGPKLGSQIRAGTTPSGIGALAERDVQTAQGRRMSREDQLKLAEELYGRLPDAGYDEAEEYYRKMRDPEEQRKQRKEDMWMTLAQIGASMASTKSPYFLQAAGEAIAAALPGASASRKERKEAERDAVRGLMEVNKLRRGEAKEVLTYANQAYGTELEAENQQANREAQAAEAAANRAARREEVMMEISARIEAAKIAASKQDKDLMTMAVMNKYAELQKINANRPLRQGNEPFDPNRHRLADETVFDNAFKSVIGTRYPQQGGGAFGIPPAGGVAPSGGGAASGNQYSGFSAEEVG